MKPKIYRLVKAVNPVTGKTNYHIEYKTRFLFVSKWWIVTIHDGRKTKELIFSKRKKAEKVYNSLSNQINVLSTNA